MSLPTVYIMCGIPGSGKTTFAKNMAAMNKQCVYISSDDIREEVCGDASDQSKNREVFQLFYERARKAIKEGSDVILDATHLTRRSRYKCMQHFKDLDCKIIAIQMMTSAEKAIRRNNKRDRVVPNYAMERMIHAFEPVSEDEGFDEIRKVK